MLIFFSLKFPLQIRYPSKREINRLLQTESKERQMCNFSRNFKKISIVIIKRNKFENYSRIQAGGVYLKRRSESNFKKAKCRSSGPASVRSTERDLEL